MTCGDQNFIIGQVHVCSPLHLNIGVYFPYCFLYISFITDKKNLLTFTRVFFYSAIISFIFIALMFDSVGILQCIMRNSTSYMYMFISRVKRLLCLHYNKNNTKNKHSWQKKLQKLVEKSRFNTTVYIIMFYHCSFSLFSDRLFNFFEQFDLFYIEIQFYSPYLHVQPITL